MQTALGGYQSIRELTRPAGRLYESRQTILDGVARSKYLKLARPMGALYAFVEVRSDVLPDFDDQIFALELLETSMCWWLRASASTCRTAIAFASPICPSRRCSPTVFARIEELLDAQAATAPALQIVGSTGPFNPRNASAWHSA